MIADIAEFISTTYPKGSGYCTASQSTWTVSAPESQSDVLISAHRKDTEKVAQGSQEAGHQGGAAHADMFVVERERYHTQWSFNHVQGL